MIKIFNKLFCIIKIIMLCLCFMITLYVLFYMYHNLGKNPFGNSFFEFFGTLFPFVLLLILFTINFSLKQKYITNNIFYNCSCVIALISIFYIGFRTLYDQNMIFWAKDSFNINFNYFSDQITQVKVLVYLMSVTNIWLMIQNRLFHKKEIDVM